MLISTHSKRLFEVTLASYLYLKPCLLGEQTVVEFYLEILRIHAKKPLKVLDLLFFLYVQCLDCVQYITLHLNNSKTVGLLKYQNITEYKQYP